MNFDRSGWFDSYLAFRRQVPLPRTLPTAGMQLFEQSGIHHELDQAAYAFLQPTGLLYGFPINSPYPELDYPQKQYLDTVGRVHLIWLDSVLACLVADRDYLLTGVHDEQDPFGHAVLSMAYYFQNLDENPPSKLEQHVARLGKWINRLPIGRNKPHHPDLERALSRRIRPGGDVLQLPQYAYNGFLYLDLYYCVAWQRAVVTEPAKRKALLAAMRSEQKAVREVLLQLLIAAAHASGDVDEGERRVFDRFLASAHLDAPRREAVQAAMLQGLTLDQIAIPEIPWLVRRHLLDLTLVLILADRQFAESEQIFVTQLAKRLGLWEEELDQSQAALLAFLVNNEKTLHFIKGRSQVGLLADRVTNRTQTLLRKNLDRLVNEIRETKELYDLLMKSRSQALTHEEKSKVRAQLYDILKTVPTLAIFALPGGSLVLPILIRLLPFNLLPTSFED